MTVFWPRRLQTFTINCMQKPAHVHRLYNPLYSFTGPGSQKNTVLTCFSHIKLICLKGVRPVFICEPSPVNAPLGSKIPTCIFIDGAMSLNIPPQDTRLKLSYAYLWCRVPLRPLRSSLFICLEEEGFSLPTEASFSFILPMLSTSTTYLKHSCGNVKAQNNAVFCATFFSHVLQGWWVEPGDETCPQLPHITFG